MTCEPAEQDLLAGVPTDLYIDGRWRPAASGRRFAVHDPSTDAVLTQVADAGGSDALAALGAADSARQGWANTPARDRSDLLREAFDLVVERRDDLALLMTLEMGKPLEQSQSEVTYGAEFLRWFSEEAVRVGGRYGANPEGTGRVIVHHRPVGPCLLITPWNFPLAMATRKIAPALAAGCTVVVKPAAQTPLTTLALTAILAEVGVPAGVVNVVPTTDPASISAPLLADHRLRKLSFTGSTTVGRELLARAAGRVLRTSMELGGNAPFLVFEDADLDAAVAGAMTAKFRNIGQACTAANRFLVHSTVAEEFTARVSAQVGALPIGRGTTEGVQIGPLIDASAVDTVAALVTDAVSHGARLSTGGAPVDGPGHYYPPTVLSAVPTNARLWSQEIFGPVLPITTFGSEDEAVRLANDTEFGLVAYAYTRDLTRAQRLMERLEVGMLGINVGVVSNAAAPFGGVKQSGLGREGGTEGIHEYLSTMYALTPAPWR